jgi:hypothetical protein
MDESFAAVHGFSGATIHKGGHQMSQQRRKVFRITPEGDRWKLHEDSGHESVFDTQEEAVREGRKVAKEAGHSQLMVHGADGRFKDENTYDQDPYPPAG